MHDQKVEQAEVDLQLALPPQIGALQLGFTRQSLEPRDIFRGIRLTVVRLLKLLFDLGSQVAVISIDALELPVESLVQLTMVSVCQR